MGFNCGIVGLPNVGKSTLFNALTKTANAQAANYPFCTIEPNVGRVGVPDYRLHKIAGIAGSAKIIPTSLEFVDIAGLVKGASRGEGLGNQFLGHIREVDAILHVLRCFEDGDIVHVENSIDPLRDKEIIETELMLADMESLERRLKAMKKKDSDLKELLPIAEEALALLQEGKPARAFKGDLELLKKLQLLTSKPVLYICNVREDEACTGNQWTEKVKEMALSEGASHVIISAAIEAEVATLPVEDQQEYLATLGLSESGLDRVIHEGYRLLNLNTFFTAGPQEARAWTVQKNALAPQGAGVIHSDFEHGFICAETISYDDFIACEGEAKAKEAGKLRVEGRSYLIKDGDVLHFRFNVTSR